MAQGKIIGAAVYLLFLFAVYIAVAIANGRLAARLDRSAAAYVVLFFVIDRLKSVAPAGRS